MDALVFAGRSFSFGTGQYCSRSVMPHLCEAHGTDIITVAGRRVNIPERRDREQPQPNVSLAASHRSVADPVHNTLLRVGINGHTFSAPAAVGHHADPATNGSVIARSVFAGQRNLEWNYVKKRFAPRFRPSA
jgi:hypothetical protein